MRDRKSRQRYDQAAVRAARKRDDAALDFIGVAYPGRGQFYSQGGSHALHRGQQTDAGWVGIAQHHYTRHTRGDLLEQFQPFGAHTVFERCEARHVTARACAACHKPGAYRVNNVHEHEGDGAGRLLQSGDGGAARWEDQFRIERDQFANVSANQFTIADGSPAIVNAQVGALDPAQLLERLLQRGVASLTCRIGFEGAGEHAYAPHPLGLLRARHERPRRSATERPNEGAPSHSMTSSARCWRCKGTSKSSALAAFRLIVSTYLVGA